MVDPLTAAHKTAEMLVTLGLSHPAAPVPSMLSGLLPGLFGGATTLALDDEGDLGGDTCAVIGTPETALV